MRPRNFPARVLLRRYRAAHRAAVGGYVSDPWPNPDVRYRLGRDLQSERQDHLGRELEAMLRAYQDQRLEVAAECDAVYLAGGILTASEVVPERITVTPETFDEMLAQVATPRGPTPALRALFAQGITCKYTRDEGRVVTAGDRRCLRAAAAHPGGNVVGVNADARLRTRLLAEGWIAFSHWHETGSAARGPVAIYKITDAGRAAVASKE